jgi:quinol monooxygenase YgiN
MQRFTLVRYAVKPEKRAENEALARAVFDSLRDSAPRHLSYAVFRREQEFVHVFMNLREDDSTALTDLPAFKAYSQDIAGRCEASPEITRLDLSLLDSYGVGS